VYRYLDSLDAKAFDAPLVEVTDLDYRGNKQTHIALLTSPGTKSFDVIELNRFQPEHFEKNASYRVLDTNKWLTDYVEGVRAKVRAAGPDQPIFNPDVPRDLVFASVASRLADKRGLEPIADQFFQWATSNMPMYGLRGRFTMSPDGKITGPLIGPHAEVDALAELISEHAGDSLIYAMMMRKEPDAQIISEAHAYIKRYPKGETIRFATDIATTFANQVQASLKHTSVDKAQATPSQLIDEAVFKLTEEGGDYSDLSYFLARAGRVMSNDKTKVSPYVFLVDQGYVAVPSLVEALDDMRFTRAYFGSGHPGIYPEQIVRVHDLAERILTESTGQEFRKKFQLDPPKDVRARALAWWSNAKVNGEVSTLDASIRAVQGNLRTEADRLLTLAPDRAITAIAASFDKFPKDSDRSNVLYALTSHEPVKAAPFIRNHMQHGRGRFSRVTAAKIIATTDPEAAVDAMIEEFGRPNENDYYPAWGDQDLDRFLVDSRRTRAVSAVRKGIDKLPPARRSTIVVYVGPANPITDLGETEVSKIGASETDRRQFLPAVEELLVHELRDLDRDHNGDIASKYFTSNQPRICDIASFRLADLFPGKYRFPKKGSAGDEEKARIFNLWVAGSQPK